MKCFMNMDGCSLSNEFAKTNGVFFVYFLVFSIIFKALKQFFNFVFFICFCK